MKKSAIKKAVQNNYARIAIKNDPQSTDPGLPCCENENLQSNLIQIGEMLGYDNEELMSVPDGANLGLGCGNPGALGTIEAGDRVLDLGSGAGFDAFLAAKRCGDSGMVIGVDFTPEMIDKASKNAMKGGYANVKFVLGDIEALPEEIKKDYFDVVMSNCVINLTPNKEKVFKEAYRVLKKGGRLLISDIVLLEDLSEEQRADKDLLCGCVGGAMLRDDYIEVIKASGFQVEILEENMDISKQQYRGLPVESLKLAAIK